MKLSSLTVERSMDLNSRGMGDINFLVLHFSKKGPRINVLYRSEIPLFSRFN